MTQNNPLNGQPEKIRVRHLLVKHTKSRRPASWKQVHRLQSWGLTQDPITRTPEEAMEIIKSYQDKIQTGSISLGELAASESDCSSARKHGDLGYFGRGEMQPEFENAAFQLGVGEISPIVSSQSGLHLIERIA